MRAVVLEALGDPSHFKLKEIETPLPKKGQVRVRIKAAGFNPVDYRTRKGTYGDKAPLILGADCSGIVDALGPDAKGFSMGDEVIAFPFGQCSNGSYAEFVCLPEEFVVKKPKNISFEQAASIPVVALTAYRSVIAPAPVKKGDTIFIAGAGGGVGSLAVPLARYAQAKAIYTVARNEESAEFMQRELGIKKEHILLYPDLTVEQLQEKLIAMNNGQLFDATFDFVGQDMKRLCLNITAHSGHFSTPVLETASFDFPVWQRGTSLCFNRNLSLHFVFIGAESFSGPRSSWGIYAKQLNEICELIEKGVIKTPAVKILGNLSVETVVQAHHLLEEGKVKGKLVMKLVSS